MQTQANGLPQHTHQKNKKNTRKISRAGGVATRKWDQPGGFLLNKNPLDQHSLSCGEKNVRGCVHTKKKKTVAATSNARTHEKTATTTTTTRERSDGRCVYTPKKKGQYASIHFIYL